MYNCREALKADGGLMKISAQDRRLPAGAKDYAIRKYSVNRI